MLTTLQLLIALQKCFSLYQRDDVLRLIASFCTTKPKPFSPDIGAIESLSSASGTDTRSLTSERTAPPTAEPEVTSAWDYTTPYVCAGHSEDLYTVETRSPPSPSSKLLAVGAGIHDTAPRQSIHRGEVSFQEFALREDGLLIVSDHREILSQDKPGFEVPSFRSDLSGFDRTPLGFDMYMKQLGHSTAKHAYLISPLEPGVIENLGISEGLQPGSRLLSTRKHFPGIHQAYYYLSTERSVFEAHKEDFGCRSANDLLAGAPKLWITVYSEDCIKFESKMAQKFSIDRATCSQFIRHQHCLVPTELLQQWNIRYDVRLQTAGCRMLVCGDTYHWGINLGPNLAIAINYTEPDWVPPPLYNPCDPKKYPKCPASSIEYSDMQIVRYRKLEVDLCFLDSDLKTTSPFKPKRKLGRKPKKSANPASGLGASSSNVGLRRSSRLGATQRPEQEESGSLEQEDPETPEQRDVKPSRQGIPDTVSISSVGATSVGMPDRQQTPVEMTLTFNLTSTSPLHKERTSDTNGANSALALPIIDPGLSPHDRIGRWIAFRRDRVTGDVSEYIPRLPQFMSLSSATHTLERFIPNEDGSAWLNDEIVNGVINVLFRSAGDVCVVDSLCLTKAYETRDADRLYCNLDARLVILPCFYEDHWSLVILEERKNLIIYDVNQQLNPVQSFLFNAWSAGIPHLSKEVRPVRPITTISININVSSNIQIPSRIIGTAEYSQFGEASRCLIPQSL